MTGKVKDKVIDTGNSVQTCLWKNALVVVALSFFFAVTIYICVTPTEAGSTNSNGVTGKVVGRISRSIEGLPDAGKNIVNAVVQRNALVELDPDYLRDRHKSASKRRVKKVLKSDDYWKFRNEMEAARQVEEATYDDVLAVNDHKSLSIPEDKIFKLKKI